MVMWWRIGQKHAKSRTSEVISPFCCHSIEMEGNKTMWHPIPSFWNLRNILAKQPPFAPMAHGRWCLGTASVALLRCRHAILRSTMFHPPRNPCSWYSQRAVSLGKGQPLCSGLATHEWYQCCGYVWPSHQQLSASLWGHSRMQVLLVLVTVWPVLLLLLVCPLLVCPALALWCVFWVPFSLQVLQTYGWFLVFFYFFSLCHRP